MRQSEKWLKDSFGFSFPGGYCIEGRSSTKCFQGLTYNKNDSIFFFGLPKLHANHVGLPVKNSDILVNPMAEKYMCYPEIKKALEILLWLMSMQFNTGPVHSSKVYNCATFDRRVELLVCGEYSVQCSGFRDLFVWLYRAEGFSVRSIDANCTLPRFKDLVNYGHSLCEVFLKEINRWVILDPWFGGAMITDEFGLVGLAELASKRENQSNPKSLVSLIKKHKRYIYNSSAGKTSYVFDISMLDEYHYYFSGCCMPGYLDYFQFVRLRSVNILPRFCMLPILYLSKLRSIVYSLFIDLST